MKHITFKSAFMAMALVCSGVAFTACEDDIEVPNNASNPWENVGETFGAVRSAAGARMGTTLTVRNGEAATGYVYFELSKAADTDTQVTFTVNNDLLQSYNDKNGTNYTAYSGVTLANGGTVTIPAGQRKSDYVAVNIPAGGDGNAVAITATANDGVTVSQNNAMYVYQVAQVNIPQHNKAIKNLCYIEVNNENPLNAGEYTLSNGEPFFDIVSIFAANMNLSADGKPYIYCNDQVTFVLQHADEIIRPLQEKGIKVHLSILGNHDDAGMRSLSEEGARAFAQELKMYADIYGFDGFDFDDEYSSYAEGTFKGSATSGSGVVASVDECTGENYTRMLEICREVLPKSESAFGIYWYREDDHPVGSNLEDLIDYTVYGTYGAFHEYYSQDVSNEIEAPYAITLVGENDNGNARIVPVNEEYLQTVKDNYGYFAFYNLRSNRLYTPTFDEVADILYDGQTVEWTGNVYSRTEMTPVQFSIPSYDSYIGTWNVTSANSLYYFISTTDDSQWWDWHSSKEFTIRIEAREAGKTYNVYGWESDVNSSGTVTDTLPFVMEYNEDYGTATVSVGAFGELNGQQYAMGVGTYTSNPISWPANEAYIYRLETSPGGTVQMISNTQHRYGLSVYSVGEDGTYTSLPQVTEDHSCGTYTLSR